ncbi:MAG: diacylglycerol kinase family protein [Bacteroidales bacterium]|nr:diacylglycerol kinase family protein [Bacteroidales bacterium]
MTSKPFSPGERLKSFRWAARGIREVYRTQHNFRIHLILAAVVTLGAFLLKVSRMEWLILIICIVSVLAAEFMNSALERMVDLLSPQQQISAGFIKDAAAAAVLIIAIGAAVIGSLIFLPYFL